MRNYEIKAATAQDILDFYHSPFPYSAKAWVVRIGEKPVAMAGVYFQRSQAVAFSRMKIDGLNLPKKMIWRGVLDVWHNIRELGYPVVAVCSDEFLNSAKMLKKLGFVLVGGNLYRYG